MAHYLVGYHDTSNHTKEICEYADDAYNAIRQAKLDLPELVGHPHASEYVVRLDLSLIHI